MEPASPIGCLNAKGSDWRRRAASGRGEAKNKRAEMDMASIVALAGFVAACFLAALTGVWFPPGPWYERLKKPWWRPPNWLFAPVWTVLYVMMAIAGWLIWRQVGFAGAGLTLAAYLLQLALNAAWTPLFFGLRRPDLGFFNIVLLWLSIVATIVLFAPISVAAALLLVPYLAWVMFAGALNFALWRLNAPVAPLTKTTPRR
jgi:tryptophan-rich sensory protein